MTFYRKYSRDCRPTEECARLSYGEKRSLREALSSTIDSIDSGYYYMIQSPKVNMKLEDHIRAAIRRRAYSRRTETAYVD